ncbi:unnamed protein product [Zymoseptoria tritici ST99CH_3D7]|uniref:Uncharacterized protein n=1 Tax=Zymoseptoria tritici (strain ST99CH_3D7) TaxID=1276538 RepID=A0A1X7RDE7_ZYMT9|nr:unnamed protein product [Zymoseptoria tritici ST99CH_3D7]
MRCDAKSSSKSDRASLSNNGEVRICIPSEIDPFVDMMDKHRTVRICSRRAMRSNCHRMLDQTATRARSVLADGLQQY